MNKNKLSIKEWIESVSYEKRKPSMKYNGTVNSSTKIHCFVLCMDLIFCPRFPNYWNWISPYSLIRYPCFSRRQDLTSYLYSKFSCKIWVFFFLNTSHPFPVDSRTFALPSKDFRKISTTQLVAQPSYLWVHPFPLIRSKLTRRLELTCRLR